MNQTDLKERLHYNPETGTFLWYRTLDIAGCLHSAGYIVISIDGTQHRAHRLAWVYMTGELAPAEIDHINHVRSDNRWINLRAVTRSQNAQNRGAVAGIRKSGKKFQARIKVDGSRLNLGAFDTPEEAHAAYMAAKAVYHI